MKECQIHLFKLTSSYEVYNNWLVHSLVNTSSAADLFCPVMMIASLLSSWVETLRTVEQCALLVYARVEGGEGTDGGGHPGGYENFLGGKAARSSLRNNLQQDYMLDYSLLRYQIRCVITRSGPLTPPPQRRFPAPSPGD